MFKYLPSLKKLSKISKSSIQNFNKQFNSTNSEISFTSTHKFNFSSDGKPQKKELSFFERLKEKFTIKESEKIDQSKLQKRNEEEDSQFLSTKIENELTFTEEERKNLQQLMEQETLEKENLEIDRINTDIEIQLSDTHEGKFDKNETFEILIKNFDLKLYEPNLSVRRQYNELKYEEVIQPRLEELMKIGFDKSQVKVILQK
jgi:hypothetical protein